MNTENAKRDVHGDSPVELVYQSTAPSMQVLVPAAVRVLAGAPFTTPLIHPTTRPPTKPKSRREKERQCIGDARVGISRSLIERFSVGENRLEQVSSVRGRLHPGEPTKHGRERGLEGVDTSTSTVVASRGRRGRAGETGWSSFQRHMVGTAKQNGT